MGWDFTPYFLELNRFLEYLHYSHNSDWLLILLILLTPFGGVVWVKGLYWSMLVHRVWHGVAKSYDTFLSSSFPFPPPPTPFFLQSTPRHSRCLQYAWLTVLNTVLASNILLGLIYPQPLLPVFQCRMSALLCSSQSFIFTGQFETCLFVNSSTMKSSILLLPLLDANTVGVWWVLFSARYQCMTCEASLS